MIVFKVVINLFFNNISHPSFTCYELKKKILPDCADARTDIYKYAYNDITNRNRWKKYK